MRPSQQYSALDPTIEREARECLHLLLEHIAKSPSYKPIKDQPLTFKHSPNPYYNSDLTVIALPHQRGNYNAFFEEASHFIRSCTNPFPNNDRTVDEFFGYLGRHIGKSLLEQLGKNSFIIPLHTIALAKSLEAFNATIASADLLKKELALLEVFTDLYRTALLAHNALQSDQPHKAKNLLARYFSSLDKQALPQRATVIQACKASIQEYSQALTTWHQAKTTQSDHHQNFLIGKKEQIKVDTFLEQYKLFTENYRTTLTKTKLGYPHIKGALDHVYLSLITHANGYLAAEAFVQDHEDFLDKAPSLFYEPDEAIRPWFDHPHVQQFKQPLEELIDEYNLF